MTTFALLYALHVLAALIWVGGMFFAWMVLRPAAATLQPAERLPLWVEVFRRFFRWVWLSLLVLPVSGIGLWHLRFEGLAGAPRYVYIMAGLYLVMLALFLRIQLLQLPTLERSVTAKNWAEGGAALGKIRQLVGINLFLGLLVVALASARPSF